MKITKDGFIWLVVEPDLAFKIWESELFQLYILYNDDSESMVESESQLSSATTNGLKIGIEVGFLHGYNKVREKAQTSYLCKCNMCDAVLIDENPAIDAKEQELTGNEQEMELLQDESGTFYGCPNCKTDNYLMDL